jgi:hypothetical protein
MSNVSKTWYFPQNDLHVVVTLLPNGEYGAYREEIDEGRYRGFGRTPLEAIADLVEMVGGDYSLI